MNKAASGTQPQVNSLHIVAQELKDDGVFPNSHLPLIVYRNAVSLPEQDPAGVFESLFSANEYAGCWRNGIYPYHHYHSTAHEVLGVYSGSAMVQLGGEDGVVHRVRAGDALLIPAGVAHKNLGSTEDFGVVGAYPDGRDWDLNCGKPGERPQTDRNIARVPVPQLDPIYGPVGPLLDHWTE